MRWTIGSKIAAGFSAVIILMLVAFGLSFRALFLQQERLELLAEHVSAPHGGAEVAGSAADDLVRSTNQEIRRVQVVAGSLFALSLLLAAGVAVYRTRAIARPLAQVAEVADRVAGGDLTVPELAVTSRDDIGHLGQSVNVMLRGLRTLIAETAESVQQAGKWADELRSTAAAMAASSHEVADAVSQIAQGTSTQSAAAADSLQQVRELQQAIAQIAAGAQQQASQAETVAADGERMMAELTAVAEKSAAMRQIAEQTLSTAHSGKRVVDESVEAMKAIRGSVERSAALVAQLGDLSGQIGAITDTITEIADQTNLLALNAAIEAARAGDQGRGFAVVADEVRHLAERVASSAGNIAELIEQIRTATKRAVGGITEVNDQVQRGAQLAEEGGRALEEIVAMVEETTGHVASISDAATHLVSVSKTIQDAINQMAALSGAYTTAAEEMTHSAQYVTEAFESIAATAEQTAAASEEVAASTEELTAGIEQITQSTQHLSDLVGELSAHIGRFRS